MVKPIKEIMGEFVRDSKKILNLESILEFGSSAYMKNFKDIDLMFLSKDKIIPTKERLALISIIKKFERRYPEVAFDFAGVNDRDRKGKYSLSVVFVSKNFLNIKLHPHNVFFLKLLTLNKRMNVIYGRNPFTNFKTNFNKKHLLEMLDYDVLVLLRNSLDGREKKLSIAYLQFKGFLRAMLIHRGDFKKNDLLTEFKKEYGDKILLPKSSKRILTNHLVEGDFEEILTFMENCLRYLAK